jgi:hypothetical protein
VAIPQARLTLKVKEGVTSMCDYSLHNVRSRPAETGDRLMTTKFRGTMTRGFAAVDEQEVAVCLRPGTELVFDRDAELGNTFARWLPFLRRKPAGRVARFRQANVERHDTHHDALEFADGTVVLLTCLRPGQRATILQLPPTTRPSHEHAAEADQLADVALNH